MKLPKNYDQVDKWKSVMFLYKSALSEMEIKIGILSNEFKHLHNYNPIEHFVSRIKSPESIVKKLRKNGFDDSIESMVEQLNDIAGIRIICSFKSDIYNIANVLTKHKDITVLQIKDYIKSPKKNGYQSYHMVVSIPIYLAEGVSHVKVEMQIRTIAMDFWAALEHKIYYKFEGSAPVNIIEELKACADMVNSLDERMRELNESVQQCGLSSQDLN